ncbi:MAG TPA: hypothetical protein VH593_09150, partial [Ktedonobacteraceae bacterium]
MPIHMQSLCSYYKKAFRWIDRYKNLFDPLDHEWEKDTPDIYQTKALGELGLLCLLYHRYDREMKENEVKGFLHLIFDVWQHAEYRERIVRRPEYFQLHVMVYITLQQCGMIDTSYKGIIQQVIDQRYVTETETTAMRLLDRRHMLDSGQFSHSLPSYEELYKNTILAKEPSLIYLTDTDVYAITHTLFYLTDFGRRNASVL